MSAPADAPRRSYFNLDIWLAVSVFALDQITNNAKSIVVDLPIHPVIIIYVSSCCEKSREQPVDTLLSSSNKRAILKRYWLSSQIALP